MAKFSLPCSKVESKVPSISPPIGGIDDSCVTLEILILSAAPTKPAAVAKSSGPNNSAGHFGSIDGPDPVVAGGCEECVHSEMCPGVPYCNAPCPAHPIFHPAPCNPALYPAQHILPFCTLPSTPCIPPGILCCTLQPCIAPCPAHPTPLHPAQHTHPVSHPAPCPAHPALLHPAK